MELEKKDTEVKVGFLDNEDSLQKSID